MLYIFSNSSSIVFFTLALTGTLSKFNESVGLSSLELIASLTMSSMAASASGCAADPLYFKISCALSFESSPSMLM